MGGEHALSDCAHLVDCAPETRRHAVALKILRGLPQLQEVAGNDQINAFVTTGCESVKKCLQLRFPAEILGFVPLPIRFPTNTGVMVADHRQESCSGTWGDPGRRGGGRSSANRARSAGATIYQRQSRDTAQQIGRASWRGRE